MPVSMRLMRRGTTHNPVYRISVGDSRKAPTAKFIEHIGTYNPKPDKMGHKQLRLNVARAKYWIAMGVQPSSMVARLLSRFHLIPVPPQRITVPTGPLLHRVLAGEDVRASVKALRRAAAGLDLDERKHEDVDEDEDEDEDEEDTEELTIEEANEEDAAEAAEAEVRGTFARKRHLSADRYFQEPSEKRLEDLARMARWKLQTFSFDPAPTALTEAAWEQARRFHVRIPQHPLPPNAISHRQRLKDAARRERRRAERAEDAAAGRERTLAMVEADARDDLEEIEWRREMRLDVDDVPADAAKDDAAREARLDAAEDAIVDRVQMVEGREQDEDRFADEDEEELAELDEVFDDVEALTAAQEKAFIETAEALETGRIEKQKALAAASAEGAEGGEGAEAAPAPALTEGDAKTDAVEAVEGEGEEDETALASVDPDAEGLEEDMEADELNEGDEDDIANIITKEIDSELDGEVEEVDVDDALVAADAKEVSEADEDAAEDKELEEEREERRADRELQAEQDAILRDIVDFGGAALDVDEDVEDDEEYDPLDDLEGEGGPQDGSYNTTGLSEALSLQRGNIKTSEMVRDSLKLRIANAGVQPPGEGSLAAARRALKPKTAVLPQGKHALRASAASDAAAFDRYMAARAAKDDEEALSALRSMSQAGREAIVDMHAQDRADGRKAKEDAEQKAQEAARAAQAAAEAGRPLSVEENLARLAEAYAEQQSTQTGARAGRAAGSNAAFDPEQQADADEALDEIDEDIEPPRVEEEDQEDDADEEGEEDTRANRKRREE